MERFSLKWAHAGGPFIYYFEKSSAAQRIEHAQLQTASTSKLVVDHPDKKIIAIRSQVKLTRNIEHSVRAKPLNEHNNPVAQYFD